jgi:hypothetical protein
LEDLTVMHRSKNDGEWRRIVLRTLYTACATETSSGGNGMSGHLTVGHLDLFPSPPRTALPDVRFPC